MTPPLPIASRALLWGGGCAVSIGFGGWMLGTAGHGALLVAALPFALIWAVAGLGLTVLLWLRTPLPYPIVLTGGQYGTFNAPTTLPGTLARLVAENLGLWALWRNTHTTDAPPHADGMPRMAWTPAPWLGIWAMLFHLGLIWTLLHHLPLWLASPPDMLLWLARLDTPLDLGSSLGSPHARLSGFGLLLAASALLGRRLFIPRLRQMSLPVDVLLPGLIIGLALTGLTLRHGVGVDLVQVRLHLLATFGGDAAVAPLPPLLAAHLALAVGLLLCLPATKLTHACGIWLSPTRGLPCDTRGRAWADHGARHAKQQLPNSPDNSLHRQRYD